MLMEKTAEKMNAIVTKVNAYADEHGITSKDACLKLKVKPYDYYTFKSKLKKEGKTKVITYNASPKKIATKKPLQQSKTLTVIIGTPDEVMLVLRGLNQ